MYKRILIALGISVITEGWPQAELESHVKKILPSTIEFNAMDNCDDLPWNILVLYDTNTIPQSREFFLQDLYI